MGTRSGSPLGDMSGKIGTINLTTWKSISVVKSLPTKTNKVSFEQKCQRNLFKTVQAFLYRATSTIKLGYQLPRKCSLSEMNMATSYTMLNAVLGEYPDYSIDMSKLKFSSPIRSIETGWNTEFTGGTDNIAELSWEINPFPDKVTCWDDHAVIVVYDTTHATFFRIEGIKRRDLGYTFTDHYRELFAGNELFCWLFFISADSKFVSETEYLGMVKMPEL